jgi:putative flippase GtrA
MRNNVMKTLFKEFFMYGVVGGTITAITLFLYLHLLEYLGI